MSNLISILGNNGSGKTFILTYFGTKFKNPIYSNYELKLDNYIPLKMNDLLDLNKFSEGSLFIDEAYTWLESRSSGSCLNLLSSYAIFQKRKRFLDMYLTEQLFSSIDKRARELSNIIIECYPRVNFLKDDFNFTYIDIDSQIEFDFMIPYSIAEKYFHYYNTYEIIEPHNKSKYEYDLVKNNPELLLEKAIKIAENDIRPNIDKKITHDKIHYWLLKTKHDVRFKKTIYVYLKEIFKDNDVF